MDSVTLYMVVLAAIVVPAAYFAVYMVHRERLEDEAAEADEANRTAAE